jgi:putative NIF3 family GTP cyclohydrolase 1 type 2
MADAIERNADVYLTADIKYHQFFEVKNDLILADIGHFESEQFIKDLFFELVSKINPKFAIHFSDYKINPIKYI